MTVISLSACSLESSSFNTSVIFGWTRKIHLRSKQIVSSFFMDNPPDECMRHSSFISYVYYRYPPNGPKLEIQEPSLTPLLLLHLHSPRTLSSTSKITFQYLVASHHSQFYHFILGRRSFFLESLYQPPIQHPHLQASPAPIHLPHAVKAAPLSK